MNDNDFYGDPYREKDIYQEIKQRIDALYRNRTQYFGHLTAFLILNIGGWVLISGSDASMGFFAFLSIAWLTGLGVHTINFAMTELRERALREELDRAGYYQRAGKAKRDERLVRLSDDGEIVDVDGEMIDMERRA